MTHVVDISYHEVGKDRDGVGDHNIYIYYINMITNDECKNIISKLAKSHFKLK